MQKQPQRGDGMPQSHSHTLLGLLITAASMYLVSDTVLGDLFTVVNNGPK
jgi:hypothetical protein